MRRSLIHFWRMNLAVAAGAAVATAVLTGALVVGDSLRESLRRLTLDRLGPIEHAVVSEPFLRAAVAEALTRRPEVSRRFDRVVPAIAARASAVHADSSARASRVSLYGVDQSFWSLFALDPSPFDTAPTTSLYPPVVVNEALRRELGAEPGDGLLLQFERAAQVPGASLLGERDAGQRLASLRLTLTAVLPDRGVGRFGLSANQTLPLNAFVPLGELQRGLQRDGRINLLLIADSDGLAPLEAPTGGGVLESALRQSLAIEDIGLRLEAEKGHLEVTSDELVLRPEIARAVERAARELVATPQPILTYLANTLTVGERILPYSTVAALELPPPPVSGGLELTAGTWPTPDQQQSLLLNRWAADDLGAEPGDEIHMSFFVVDARDELRVESTSLELAGVVELAGLGADPGLTPEVPGIAEADDMAAWDPPFPVDLGLIRSRDEEYWDRFRGAPKALVPLATGRRLWRSRFGDTTSIRLKIPEDLAPAEIRSSLQSHLFGEGSLEALGLHLEPLKQRGLAAASGTTDFAGLFVGFSLFLIVSACLLVGLLFSLLVESRAREMGARRAVGFPLKKVRRLLLAEGALLAGIGALAGLGLAMLYARGVLAGLQSWWAPLVDTPFLRFHAEPSSLAVGFGISVLLVLISIAATVRRLGKTPLRALLAGVLKAGRPPRRRRRARAVALGSTLAVLVLLVLAAAGGRDASPVLFFGLGTTLCVAGLAGFALWLGRPQAKLTAEGWGDLWRMAARNGAANPGRSLLCVALVASACFVLVSVTANRRDFADAPLSRDSGAGGFALAAESDVPLPRTLATGEDLAELGFQVEQIAALAGATTYALRLVPGEDASCLNLYQPERPRLLGVPPAMVERGGFVFRDTLDEVDNPWTLLEKPMEPGVIPAIGDYNSVLWILHMGLGEDLEMEDDHGETVRLRIVGLLEKSIFQSELLVSQDAFLEHFPEHGGFSFFLTEAPAEKAPAIAGILEETLGPFGFDSTPTADRLARFQAIEEMYLTTFQALGGLGLLLGTLGLGVVLIRNVLERRGELATLQACGYRRHTLAWLVLAEHGFLLLVGLLIGAIAGFVAVTPHLLAAAQKIPLGSLFGALGAVLGVGLAASAAAVVGALRIPLLPALKAE